MGTNYYLEDQEPCSHCGRPYERVHIGKSSGGWCFSLHVIPERGINSLEDWKANWQGKKIYNEYGDEVSHEEMISIITERSWNKNLPSDPNWFSQNYAEIGPNNLARHKIDGHHCIGHGDGTWDLIATDFS